MCIILVIILKIYVNEKDFYIIVILIIILIIIINNYVYFCIQKNINYILLLLLY